MRDILALTTAVDESPGETDSSAPANTVENIYPSSSSEYDVEKQRSTTTSSNDDAIHDHVDVQYAEKQFAELKRRYSDLSRVTSHTSQRSRRKTTVQKHEQDATSEVDSDDEFDLEDMLRDRHRKEVEHDIKPKHLGIFCHELLISGVVFENLRVCGFGGAKYFIKTFPDAFVDFFNLWGTFKSMFGKKRGTEFDILKDFTGCVRPGEVELRLT
jgi:hypothetical protein